MKKHISIAMIILLSVSVVVRGQVPGSAPRPVNCTDSPETPIAGKLYTYEVSADPAGGSFLFWATKNTNFISTDEDGITTNNLDTKLNSPTTAPNGSDLLATSANYAVSNNATSVSITWSDAVLNGTTATSPTFVAAHYTALNDNCADNFKAWQINPIYAFTVDIRNMHNESFTPLTYDEPTDQCLDLVRGASFNGTSMEYDYGTQYLYFEVVAANFTDSWTPSFALTGLHAAQTSTIQWTAQNPVTDPWTAATVWNPASTTVVTTETNTNNGISIYVRVTIQNNNYEGTDNRIITLAVDGQNSVGDWDIVNNSTTDPGPLCAPATNADQNDIAQQTLKLRPTETPDSPAAFLTGNNQN